MAAKPTIGDVTNAAVKRSVGGGLKPDPTVDHKAPPPLSEVLQKAGKRALGGGIPGAMAMVAQVTSLMWLRTTMNYQYRHGTTTTAALKHLYADVCLLSSSAVACEQTLICC